MGSMQKGIYINPTTFVPLNQISQGLTAEIATRNFAMGGYAGFFSYLPDPDPVLRKLGCDQTVYEDLLSDDQVGPLFNRRKNLVKALDWYIERNDAGDAEYELCETMIEILEAFGCKTKDLISQSLNPIGYGYSVFEINWDFVNGKLLPVGAWEKPREWFFFDTENQLRFRTLDNYEGILINGKNADPKIAAKFILLQNDPSYKNPYGDKALSRCFWPVTFKRGGMRFFSTFVEKWGMPYLFGKLPRGAKQEDHDDLLQKLSNMVQDVVATGPDDSTLQILETKGSSNADLYDKYLQRCDNAISKALLLNALSTDIQRSGARASSETGAITIEGDISETDRDFPVAFFNELFKRIIDLNIGSGKYCTFEVKELDDAKKDFSERDKYLSEAAQTSGQQIKRTKEFYINNYNYKNDEFEIVDQKTEDRNQNSELKTELIPTVQNVEMSGWKKFWNKLFHKNIELSSSDNFIDSLSNALPDKLLQFAMEETLQPVFELAKKSTSREEFKNGLAALYPDMSTKQFEDLATKIFFIAELEGRFNK